MSNDSQNNLHLKRRGFGDKRLVAVFVTLAVAVLILAVSLSGLFASSPDLASQPEPTPSPTATPTPTPTATPSPTPMPVPIDFTCGEPANPYTFSVTVNVDLNNGMDQDEAIMVANAIIDHKLTDAAHEVKSVQAYPGGAWGVNLGWEYNSFRNLPDGSVAELNLGHIFNVHIYSQNRTVTYAAPCL